MEDSRVPTDSINGIGQEEVRRVTNMFKVTSVFTVDAETSQEAGARIRAFRQWLRGLSLQDARGTRFLDAWGAIMDDPNSAEFANVERPGDLRSSWTVEVVFGIHGQNEDLARDRFLGLRDWLAKIADTRSIEVAHVGSPCLAAPHMIEFEQIVVEPINGPEWLYPQADAWFDLSDKGETEERDTKEAIAFAALDSFLLHTDEEREALDALEQAAFHLHRVDGDIYAWKWVILALHGSLQAFMVLALQGTNPVRVTGDDGRLLSFFELYDRVKKPKYMGMLTTSKPFKPNGTQTRNVKKLCELRDSFTHFDPKGWSLEVESFPRMVHEVADVIRFLFEESGNISWVGDDSRRSKAENALQDVLTESRRLSNAYADRAKVFMKPGKHHAFRVGGAKQA